MPDPSGRAGRRPPAGRPSRRPPIVLVGSIAGLAMLAACSGSFETSKGRILQLVDARREARGAWITVSRLDEAPIVAGELLAASADSFHVLTGGRVVGLSAGDLPQVVIALYEAPNRVVGAPVLIIRGDGARGGSRMRGTPAPVRRGDRPDAWRLLVPHARFPQGLPIGFGRDSTAAR